MDAGLGAAPAAEGLARQGAKRPVAPRLGPRRCLVLALNMATIGTLLSLMARILGADGWNWTEGLMLVAFGVTLPWLSLGLSLRSPVRLSFRGEADFDAPPAYRGSLPPDGEVRTQVDGVAMMGVLDRANPHSPANQLLD